MATMLDKWALAYKCQESTYHFPVMAIFLELSTFPGAQNYPLRKSKAEL